MIDAVSDLRIRLEGRLEVVERGTETLRTLLEMAAPRRWQGDPHRLLGLLDQWTQDAPQLDDALAAVAAHGALSPLDRQHATLRVRLSRTLARRYPPLRTERGLEARLDKWRVLADPFTHRAGLVMLEGPCRLRLPHLFKSIAATITLVASPLPWLVGVAAAACSFAYLVYCMRPATFRLYERFLEVEELGAAPLRIPHASLTRVHHEPFVLELDGLWRAMLVSDATRQLSDLAMRLNRLRVQPSSPAHSG